MVDPSASVTELLGRISSGDSRATEQLLPLIYDELRKVASVCMNDETDRHTLQPTALVHEAWIRLVGGGRMPPVNDRAHFVRVAARAMRQVLVDHARRRAAAKRQPPDEASYVDRMLAAFQAQSLDVLALHDGLERLSEIDAELGRIVELRFFAGLTNPEIAEALDLSISTVERRWRQARAWLRAEVPPPA